MIKKGFYALLGFLLVMILYSCGGHPAQPTPSSTGTESEAGVPFPISYAVAPELAGLPNAFSQEPTPTNTDHADVVFFPGGTYLLGSPTSDETAIPDEQPAHQVQLYPFWLYTHEVTNVMYAECVAAGACIEPSQQATGPTSHYSDPVYADYPVVGVDWLMADDYCRWAGGRLPTEAEWEAAARGKEALLYPWGDATPDCNLANMKGCSAEQTTEPAAAYPDGASPYKALDMAGNVWEWVNDWYSQNYYLHIPTLDPQGPNLAAEKAIKGGGFKSNAFNLRTPGRLSVDPNEGYEDLGFRCVAGGPTGVSGVEHPADSHTSSDCTGSVETGGSSTRCRVSTINFFNAFCNADGTGTYVFTARNNFSGTYSMDYDGTAFSCSYDAAGGVLTCTGTRPTAPRNGSYYVAHVYVTDPTAGLQTWATFTFTEDPVALRCNGRIRSLETHVINARIDITCPASGQIGVTVTPSESIVWGTVQLNGSDIACSTGSGGELNCLAPDSSVGGMYNFHLNATSTDGTETYSWDQGEPIPAICPHDPSETPNIKVIPYCDNANPGTYFFTANWSPSDYTFGMVEDELSGVLSCRPIGTSAMYCSGAHLASDGTLHLKFIHGGSGGFAAFWVYVSPYSICGQENPGGWGFDEINCTYNPGWYWIAVRYPSGPAVTAITLNGNSRIISLDPSNPGRIILNIQASDFPATIGITRSDGSSDSHTFNAPSPLPTCSDGNGVVPSFGAKAFCDNTNGFYIMQVGWNPPDYTIDYVREPGDGYPTCTPAVGGQIVCFGLAPANDGLITLGLFHVDPTTGDASSYRVSVAPPFCAGGTEGEGAGLQDPACSNSGGIEFYITTYPGRSYAGVAAADDINTYTCDLTSLGEGGIYRCTGPAITSSPGNLQVSLQHGDGTSYSVSFSEWARHYPQCGGEQPGAEGWSLGTSCIPDHANWFLMHITYPSSYDPISGYWMDIGGGGCVHSAVMGNNFYCAAQLPVNGIATFFVRDASGGEQSQAFNSMETRAPTTCNGGDTPDQEGGFRISVECTNDPSMLMVHLGFPSDWTNIAPIDILVGGVSIYHNCTWDSATNIFNCAISRVDSSDPLQVRMFGWIPGERWHTFDEYPFLLAATTCGTGTPSGGTDWIIGTDCDLVTPTAETYGVAHISMVYPDGLGIYPAVLNTQPGWMCWLGSAHNTIECLIPPVVTLPNPLVWGFNTPSGIIYHTFTEFPGDVPTCQATGQPPAASVEMNSSCVLAGTYQVSIVATVPILRIVYFDGTTVPASNCAGLGTPNVTCLVDRTDPSTGMIGLDINWRRACGSGDCPLTGVRLFNNIPACPAGGQAGSNWGLRIECDLPQLGGWDILEISYPEEYWDQIRTVQEVGAQPACELYFYSDITHTIVMACDPRINATSFVIAITTNSGISITHAFDPTSDIASCTRTTPTGGGQTGGGQPGGGGTPSCSSYTDNTSCSSAGCYWWKGHGSGCHDYTEPQCEDMTTKDSCTAWGGCYWWSDSTCHSYAEPAPFDCKSTYGTDKNNCLADSRCDWDGSICINQK
jgi:formylglycine-generating enzyme required for sulfatase activity